MLRLMLPKPLFSRAQESGVTVDPGLGFHEAATQTATLGIFDKLRTLLTGLPALGTNLRRDVTVAQCSASSAGKTPGHLSESSLYVSSVSLSYSLKRFEGSDFAPLGPRGDRASR